MSKKKNSIYQYGITTDNKPVYAGVFYAVGTHGIPLTMVLDYFIDRGYIVGWCDYIDHAMKDGAKLSTIKSAIEEAVNISYGRQYCGELMALVYKFYPE